MEAADQFSDIYADGNALQRRRYAIQLFTRDPAAAAREFPELKQELITFFTQSTNPNLEPGSIKPLPGKEADCEEWNAARDWALRQAEE